MTNQTMGQVTLTEPAPGEGTFETSAPMSS
jgi:hypothetical protein